MNKVFTIATSNCSLNQLDDFVTQYDNVANLGKHWFKHASVWDNRVCIPVQSNGDNAYVFRDFKSVKPELFYDQWNIGVESFDNLLPEQLIKSLQEVARSVGLNAYYEFCDKFDDDVVLACACNMDDSWSPKIYLPKKTDGNVMSMAVALWCNLVPKET